MNTTVLGKANGDTFQFEERVEQTDVTNISVNPIEKDQDRISKGVQNTSKSIFGDPDFLTKEFNSVPDLIHQAAKRFNDYVCFEDEKEKFTFYEFDRLTDRLAIDLIENFGVIKGDRIVILTENHARVPIVFYGIIKAGAIACNVHSTNNKETKMSLLNRIEPKLIFSEENVMNDSNWPQYDFAKVLTLDYLDQIEEKSIESYTQLKQTISHMDKYQKICTFPTSGSTGIPKCAIHTNNSVLSLIRDFSSNLLDQDMFETKQPVTITNSKLSWISGLGNTGMALLFGIKLFIKNEEYNKNTYFSELVKLNANIIVGKPELIKDLLNVDIETKKILNENIQIVGVGGSHIGGRMFLNAINEFPKVNFYQIYGSTEQGCLCQFNTSKYVRSILNDSDIEFDNASNPVNGFPFLDCLEMWKTDEIKHKEFKIATLDDENGEIIREAHSGETGELLIKSESSFVGYLNQEEKTKAVKIKDGWNRTGDLFKCLYNTKTEEFGLFIAGRITDMIRIDFGKYQIEPKEIEQLVHNRFEEQILECAVVGVFSKSIGEFATAFVRIDKKLCEEGTKKLFDEVNEALVKEYKPWYAIQNWYILKNDEETPRTATGKIDKVALRDKALQKFKLY